MTRRRLTLPALGLSFVLLALTLNGFSRSVSATPAKIGKSLLPLLMQKSRFPALVILKEQADLEDARYIRRRADKTRFVYDTLRKTAMSTQRDLSDFLRSHGLQFRNYYILNMIAVEDLTPALVEELSLRDDVAKVIANPAIKQELPRTLRPGFEKSLSGAGDNLEKAGATRVWEELKVRGENIVVAGQDTGVQWDHPALKTHYRGYSARGISHDYNWHDSIHKPTDPSTKNRCGYELKEPCDDNDHGTHTIGTVVGDDGGDNHIGMAPGAKWIACRNMDAGAGTPASYLECFEYFLAPYAFGKDPMKDGAPEMAPHVINNSWGCPPEEGCEGTEFKPVLKALAAAGIMVVASAGNDGPDCSTIKDQPADHTDDTLSVGAVNHRTGKIADFSSRGPSKLDGGIGPDVSAPGVSIKSSIPGGKYAQFGWSGTSMAGPHVVGEVALLWSARPELIGKIEATTEIIRKSSTPTTSEESCGDVPGSAIPNNTYGYGIIDAYQALKSN